MPRLDPPPPPEIIIPRTIDFASRLALYSHPSRPHYRGVSVQHLQMRGGERWPARGVGDAAQIPLPAGPNRSVPAHLAVRHKDIVAREL